MIERSEQGADPVPGAESRPGAPHAPAPLVQGTPPLWPPPVRPPGGTFPVPASDGGGSVPAIGSLGVQLARGAPPVDRSSAWMWLLFCGIGFVVGQVLAAVAIAAAAAAAGDLRSLTAITSAREPPTWYIAATLVGLWAGFLGAAWMSSWLKGTRHLAADLGLRFRWVDLAGIPIGVGGQFLVALIYVPISQHVHNFNQRFAAPSQRLTGGSHGAGYVVIALLTVVGAPFFEELFFRGVLLRSMSRLFGTIGGWVGPTLAIVVTGVLFGLAHDESLQLLGLATFGVVLCFVSYRTGRLGMSMVAHASFNLVAVVAVVTPLVAPVSLIR
ncbi:MAG: CPBP family intramembrane glutamic endopeptidase [Acidimicrobiales bacterium]